MSQNTRASGVLASPHGRTSNVSGSGTARTSASWMREKPSIDEPSNVIPSSRAFSSSAGLMAKLLRLPRMSVNHRRISRTPRSSTRAQDVLTLLLEHLRHLLKSGRAGLVTATAGAVGGQIAEQTVSTIRRVTT